MTAFLTNDTRNLYRNAIWTFFHLKLLQNRFQTEIIGFEARVMHFRKLFEINLMPGLIAEHLNKFVHITLINRIHCSVYGFRYEVFSVMIIMQQHHRLARVHEVPTHRCG